MCKITQFQAVFYILYIKYVSVTASTQRIHTSVPLHALHSNILSRKTVISKNHTRTHTYTHTHKHLDVLYTHTRARARTHTHKHARTHSHTHTQIPPHANGPEVGCRERVNS